MSTYTIKQGHHYHTTAFIPRITFAKTVTYEVTFDPSCLSNMVGTDALDWNKLVGISTTMNHHQDSARVGWRTAKDGQHLELIPYVYINGKRLDTDAPVPVAVLPDEPIQVSVTDTGFSYEIIIGNTECEFSKIPNTDLFYWLAGFYHGGQQVAAHTMKANITRLK